MNKLSCIIYLLKKYWSNALILAVLLFFAFVGAVGLHDCNKKGGVYVQGQCLKAEVIK